MPVKQASMKAVEYSAMINDGNAAFVILAVRRMSVAFDADELKDLAGAGFDTTDGDYSVSRKGITVTKIEIETGTYVYVRLEDGKIQGFPSLHAVTRPGHVNEFLARLAEQEPGKLMSAQLTYRGVNLPRLYASAEFNEIIAMVVARDEEILECGKCEFCMRAMDRDNLFDKRKLAQPDQFIECDQREELRLKMAELMERCREKNRKKPEDITCRAVFLGYIPAQDMFVTALDVFGSDSTGSVLIAFKVHEDGSFGYASNEECDRHRHPDIYDASDKGFYEKSSSHRSMFEHVTGNKSEQWNIIPIQVK